MKKLSHFIDQVIGKINHFCREGQHLQDYFCRYVIVDRKEQGDRFVLKSKYKRRCFEVSLLELARIPDLYAGLPPDQAAFVGKQYAHFLKENPDNEKILPHFDLLFRYGQYRLCSVNRAKGYCFLDVVTGSQRVMTAQAIMSSCYIQGFDATQALYIGFWSVLDGEGVSEDNSPTCDRKRPHLRLVK